MRRPKTRWATAATSRCIWPVFWLHSADCKTTGRLRCGEIDIMENIFKEPAAAHGFAGKRGADATARVSMSTFDMVFS
jgi:hypothetical protein